MNTNKLTEYVEYDFDKDGFVDQGWNNVYSYGAGGYLVNRLIEHSNGMTITGRQNIEMTNDEDGNRLSLVDETDFDADGSLDYKFGDFYTYQKLSGEDLDLMFRLI